MGKRDMRYDAACPSCGTPVVSLASRCKLCGTALTRTGAAEQPPVSAPVATAPAVADPIVRAHQRRAAEADGAAEPRRRSWPIILAVGGIVAVIGVATFLAVRSATAGADSTTAGSSAAAAKPDTLPPLDPADIPPAHPRSPTARGPVPLPPTTPDPFGSNPFAAPMMPGMPSAQDLLNGLGQSLRQGPPPSPAAQAFADKALGMFCSKAAACGLFDASDKTTCSMIASTMLAPSLAGALSGGGCNFDPVRAQGCLDVLATIDCGTSSPFGAGADPTQLMSLMQKATACADVLACL